MVVVVFDKGADLAFEVAGKEIVFQDNPVLRGLLPVFHCQAVHLQIKWHERGKT